MRVTCVLLCNCVSEVYSCIQRTWRQRTGAKSQRIHFRTVPTNKGSEEREINLDTCTLLSTHKKKICTCKITGTKEIIRVLLCAQICGNNHGTHLFLDLYHVQFHVLCRVYAAGLLSLGFLSISCLRCSRNWRLLLPWVVLEHFRGTLPCLRKTE